MNTMGGWREGARYDWRGTSRVESERAPLCSATKNGEREKERENERYAKREINTEREINAEREGEREM